MPEKKRLYSVHRIDGRAMQHDKLGGFPFLKERVKLLEARAMPQLMTRTEWNSLSEDIHATRKLIETIKHKRSEKRELIQRVETMLKNKPLIKD